MDFRLEKIKRCGLAWQCDDLPALVGNTGAECLFSKPSWLIIGLNVVGLDEIWVASIASVAGITGYLALCKTSDGYIILPNTFSDYTELCGTLTNEEILFFAREFAKHCLDECSSVTSRTIHPNGTLAQLLIEMKKIAQMSESHIRYHYKVDLVDFTDAAIPKTIRKHLRRALKRGFKLKKLSKSDVERYLPRFLSFYHGRWRHTPGEISKFASKISAFRTSAEMAGLDLRHYALMDPFGVPVSFRIGYADELIYYDFLTSYDCKIQTISPGNVLLFMILMKLQAEGIRAFDFMRGEEDYKKRFSTGSVAGMELNLQFNSLVAA